MKKTIKKYFALVAMIAFAAIGITSCGGSSSADEADEIPVDGLLGDVPMLTAKYCNKIVDLRNQLFSAGLTEEEAKKINEEFKKTQEERDAKLLLARETLNGKEIPVEVQNGYGVSVSGNMKIECEGKGSIYAVGKGELLKDFSNEDILSRTIVPIDTDGKAISTKSNGFFEKEDGGSLLDYKKGNKIVIKAYVSVGQFSASSKNTNEMKRWAKLAKYVIMDTRSDEFKKLKEQLEADKKAEEIEAAKKVVGEN